MDLSGKNAIIIDTSADLDEAVLGVRDSAFGFAGLRDAVVHRGVLQPGPVAIAGEARARPAPGPLPGQPSLPPARLRPAPGPTRPAFGPI